MTSRNRLEKSARQRADFTPALGRAPSTLYDLAIRLFTREKCWRRIVLRTLAPQPGERILDVGCGTGTLAIAIKSIEPMAKITGIDPDPETLVRAILIPLVVISLAGCNRPEPYSDISDDQLNHYVGIETHDHPVDNATAPTNNGSVQAPGKDPP